MKYYVVNEEGEVINELKEGTRYIEVNNGDRVIRANSIKSYKEKKESTTKIDFPFIKVNVKWVGEVSDRCALFGFLLKYITFIDNMLIFSNGTPLNTANISRASGLSYSTCCRQIEMLVKRDVIRKKRVNNRYILFFNPFVAMRGKWISNDTINLFSDSKYREGVEIE